MSSYREDTQETAVASSSTWAVMQTLAEDAAKTTTALLFGLMLSITEMAIASDDVVGTRLLQTVEEVQIEDDATSHLYGASSSLDVLKISEKFSERFFVAHDESATIADTLKSAAVNRNYDSLQIMDSLTSTIQVNLHDSLKVKDAFPVIHQELLTDSVLLEEGYSTKISARELVTDNLQVNELYLDGSRSPQHLIDSFKIQDKITGKLYAVNQTDDLTVIEDLLGDFGVYGQAWTASTDSWGMSRYEPYTFQGLAVIDGVLYGMAEDGVYALNAENQRIEGRIQTAKLDLGQGMLIHPLGAFIEYELSGSEKQLSIDVTTTQSGQAETYNYIMPSEMADYLTNGRVVFGRGLRGRHFSLTLNMTGDRGYINDLNIETASTKRRT